MMPDQGHSTDIDDNGQRYQQLEFKVLGLVVKHNHAKQRAYAAHQKGADYQAGFAYSPLLTSGFVLINTI